MALNPYHQWLGLDAENIHPNYFQLLGVTNNPANEDQYRLVVAAAVKSRLAKLQQIDAGPHHEPLRLLQERLVRAGQTLADPLRRQKYVDRIKKEGKSAGSPVNSVPSAYVVAHNGTFEDGVPAAIVASLPVQSKKSSHDNPSLFPPSTAPPSNSLNSPPVAPPVAQPAMAIPTATAVLTNQFPPAVQPIMGQPIMGQPIMGQPIATQPIAVATPALNGVVPAVPIATPAPPSAPAYRTYTMPDPTAEIPSAASPGISPTAPLFQAQPVPPSSFGSVVLNDSSSSAAIALKPVRRRSSSITGVVSVIFMLVVAVVSLVFLFQVFTQQNPNLQVAKEDNQDSLTDTSVRQQTIPKPRSNLASPSASQQPTRLKPRDPRTSPTLSSTGTLADIPLPSARPERSDRLQQNSPISDNTPMDNGRDSSADNEAKDDPFKMPSINPGLPPIPDGFRDLADGTLPGADLGEAAANDNGEMKGETVSQPTEPKVSMPVQEISPSELLDITRKFRLIRRSFQRRDAGRSAMLLMATQMQLDTLVSDGKLDAQQQERLQTHFQALQHTHQLLEGFWKQVQGSGRGMVTGNDLRIGEQTLGFVEGSPEGVILRNAGSNIFYGYEFMPPGIAVAIAEKGVIEDIPTWRMQLAAFYCMYVESNSGYQGRIDDLISQSEADGHDGTMLREYLTADFSKLGKAITKQSLLSASQIQSQMKDFEEAHGKLDPKRARPGEAELLATTLLTEVPQEPKLQIAYLEQARQLAIRSGNAFLLEDIVLELDLLAKIETAEVLVESMLELSEQKLTENQARHLMETAIPYLKSGAAKVSNGKKLATQLYKIAERAGFVDSQRRLNQL